MTRHSTIYTVNGEHHSPAIHDHVILPKHVTDDFYSTLTQCYEELFQASLLPKYVPKPMHDTQAAEHVNTELLESNTLLLHKTKSDPVDRVKLDPTRRSHQDLNEVVYRRKDIMKDLNHRLSFDLSQLKIDWERCDEDDITNSTIAKKFLDAEYVAKTRSTDDLSTRERSHLGKWLPGRKKTYKLS